jgi:nitrogen-specific signal transduction histidine kinase
MSYKEYINEGTTRVAAGLVDTRYPNMSKEQKVKLLTKKMSRIKVTADRLSKLKDFSYNDEAMIHIIFDKLTDIQNELGRIRM